MFTFLLSPIKANVLHFLVKAVLCFVVSYWSSPLLYSSHLLCMISNSPIQIISIWVWLLLIHKFFLLINEIHMTIAFPEWKKQCSVYKQFYQRPICVQCGDSTVQSDGSLCTDNAIMASWTDFTTEWRTVQKFSFAVHIYTANSSV